MGPLILQSSLIFLSYGVGSDMAFGGGWGPPAVYPKTYLAGFDQMISCHRYLALLLVLDTRSSLLPVYVAWICSRLYG